VCPTSHLFLIPVANLGRIGEDSKIRCDLSTPTCKNCTRIGKECRYGLLLSWPREGDARRSIVSHEIRRGRMIPPEHGFSPHFLNIGASDIGLYLRLSSNALNAYNELLFTPEVPRFTATLPESIPRPLSWKASGQGEFENVLLSYCKDTNEVSHYVAQRTNQFR
jgi:Fungal Zn(2)-Cys(6) binuclear cluster domain